MCKKPHLRVELVAVKICWYYVYFQYCYFYYFLMYLTNYVLINITLTISRHNVIFLIEILYTNNLTESWSIYQNSKMFAVTMEFSHLTKNLYFGSHCTQSRPSNLQSTRSQGDWPENWIRVCVKRRKWTNKCFCLLWYVLFCCFIILSFHLIQNISAFITLVNRQRYG